MNNSMLGDLASQIMAGQDPIAQPAPVGMPENSTDPLIVETKSSLDISEVAVPDSFMDQILGTTTPKTIEEGLIDKAKSALKPKKSWRDQMTDLGKDDDERRKKSDKKRKEWERNNPGKFQPLVGEDAQEAEDLLTLVQEVRDLLLDVKGVLTEMTTVGAIGVNMGAGPGKKKKGDALTEPGEDSAKDVEPMQKLIRRVKARRAKL